MPIHDIGPPLWSDLSTGRTRSLALSALLVGVGIFYFWSLHSFSRLDFRGREAGYYSLQVHGWLKGTLAMDVTPHPDLRVEYPNRITQHAPFLLDASYYRGKYYLYFGPAPALVLLLPYHLITGHDLPEPAAAAIFALVGFLLSVVCLIILQRTFFPMARDFQILAAVAALGLANLAPVALARPLFYEVAVCSGYAFAQAALLGATLAVLRPARAHSWLALASLCAGLAIGSRPNLLAGAAILLPLTSLGLWASGPRTRPRLVRLLLAGGLPVGVCLLALLAYNHARFDRWFEFGINLQLGANPQGFGFNFRNFWHNLQVYYLTPPHLDWYFPFISPGAETARPAGYYGLEDTIGQFFLLPLAGLAALLGWWCRRSLPSGPRSLALILTGVACWGLANFILVASSGVRANRYMMDFQPAALLLVVLPILAAAGHPRRWLRILSWLGVTGLVLLAAYNMLVSFRSYHAYRQIDPAGYARLEQRVNRVMAPLLRHLAPKPGVQRWWITFPSGQDGRIEPLLVTGSPTDFDSLTIEYLGPDRARLLFSHRPHGLFRGPDFSYEPGRPAELNVQLGAFFPPLAHPWYPPELSPVRQQQLRHAAVVILDGQVILDAGVVSAATLPRAAGTGRRWFSTVGEPAFGGHLEPAKAETPPIRPRQHPGNRGEIHLLLPPGKTGQREPLVTYGNPGAGLGGDGVFIEYLGTSTLRFGYDCGGRRAYSPAVSLDYLQPHTLAYEFQPSDITRARPGFIRIRLDGEAVWTMSLWTRSVPQATCLPLANPEVSAFCRPFFTGTVLASKEWNPEMEVSSPPYVLPAVSLLRDGVLVPGPQVLASWTRADQQTASLTVERRDDGTCLLGWQDADTTIALPLSLPPGRVLALRLESTATGFTLFEKNAPVIVGTTRFFDAPGIHFWLGGEALANGTTAREFGGTIRLGYREHPDEGTPSQGAMLLRLRFPEDQSGQREPLLVAGTTGAADAVYVRYVDPDHVVFGFDHWGVSQPPESPSFAIDYGRDHLVWIDFDALHPKTDPPRGHVRIRIDDHPEWTAPVTCNPQADDTLKVGQNTIGLSTCSPRFTGRIHEARPSAEPPRPGAF